MKFIEKIKELKKREEVEEVKEGKTLRKKILIAGVFPAVIILSLILFVIFDNEPRKSNVNIKKSVGNQPQPMYLQYTQEGQSISNQRTEAIERKEEKVIDIQSLDESIFLSFKVDNRTRKNIDANKEVRLPPIDLSSIQDITVRKREETDLTPNITESNKEKKKIEIYGFACDLGECVAYTNYGEVKNGSFIEGIGKIVVSNTGVKVDE